MSPRTVEHMTWHQTNDAVDGVMVHPSDGEAWKRFNSVHPDFSDESRNVCLGLCIDGFNPFGSFAAPYSCCRSYSQFITATGNVCEAGVHVSIYCHTRGGI
ncbi:hypothetical protein D5086_017416 [Populus alba]|uniref:Uncharacterized protein n=1 Tax=Populus alba TaxID=43335 RepID=A0ACC4BX59_POPAL